MLRIADAVIKYAIGIAPFSKCLRVRLRCGVRVRSEPCIRKSKRTEIVEHAVDTSYVHSHVDVGTLFRGAPVEEFYVEDGFCDCGSHHACSVVNSKGTVGEAARSRVCEGCHDGRRPGSRNAIRRWDQCNVPRLVANAIIRESLEFDDGLNICRVGDTIVNSDARVAGENDPEALIPIDRYQAPRAPSR